VKLYLTSTVKRLKVSTFIYHHLQGNLDQQWFTIQSGLLTGNDTRWHSTISGRPLPKWTDFGCCSLQPDSYGTCICHDVLYCSCLLQAVLQFYHSGSGQAEINRWLTSAQISPHAWSFAWQLIQPQKVIL